nr:RNA-directed DNA polymerase, eukaryota [Tanacetum cinerariifolium]
MENTQSRNPNITNSTSSDIENTQSVFDAKVTIRRTLHTLTSIKELLGQSVIERHRTRFLSTVFGKWLYFLAYSNDNLLLNYIFQNDVKQEQNNDVCPPISLLASMASVLVNGSPTAEFQFFRGLKQGDPLAPYLFILVMESLHLSFSRTVDVGIFKGIKIGNDITLSHFFYADDVVFIGEWSDENLSRILHVLHCFSLASGLKINVKKGHLLGVGVSNDTTVAAATNLGCAIMKAPFKYLGVMVGGNMSRIDAWDETLSKLMSRLSKWKSKTLSICGRLTLLKSVCGSSPIYAMSLYKVPKFVLSSMEAIRRNFFYGSQEADKNITWVKWSKVLAAKQFGGLGVSSLFSLNIALLMRWV